MHRSPTPMSMPSQRGATLIEVLVVMAMFAMGMLGMAQMQAAMSSWTEAARLRSEAALLARQKLDALRTAAHFASADSRDAFDAALAPSVAEEPITVGTATFRRTWSVQAHGTPAQKSVVVTVSWQDRTGAQSLVLPSVVAHHPPSSVARLALPAHLNNLPALAPHAPP